ncbi:ribosome biogenesis GTP-binding protein YihA/YsxC [Capnocytophaga catalasegens]|uniref:Probable GTP-binding protein EngB n=1 Tax=Capnocytophaga catalasegens TaxID=1004260 RepID=A0AAV5AU27_9FLAO|nr:ribosome biogenesis GTP-binding protein YihA/YsxC [Capnocytophaga catalasegens]GIZ14853.1 putative GTP-binding protein EngB [Capnocytophaga catalasegens]GJM49190.1 putative GTP-binding protein EngB [Capnocytophaga catalasegens]GJM52598.1 putative GTP-binding protein EngB [Capnocytophaga catalasegens]
MEIKQAKFVISNSDVRKCPEQNLPEYAFIGRSNVGKSSLINRLTNHKGLAKTSGKPGKTQLINHFLINNQWFLVDLPGYGYAQVSKSAKKTFQKFITDYFLKRKQLVLAFVLVDIRHEPQKIDLEFMQWLAENAIAFAIVFTKADKLKPLIIEKHVENYKQILLQWWEEIPTYFITSSTSGLGKEDVLAYIDNVNKILDNNRKK